MKRYLCGLAVVAASIIGIIAAAPVAVGQWAVCGAGKICTNSEVAISSGRPECNPRAISPPAAFDGVTDDTAAWQACITKLNALGGGRITAPAGKSCIKTAGGIVHSGGSPIEFAGAGMRATFLDSCGVDTTILNVSSNKTVVRDMSIWGKGSPFSSTKGTFSGGFTQDVLRVHTTCTVCLFYRVEVFGGRLPIKVSVGEVRFIQVYGGYGYSTDDQQANIVITGVGVIVDHSSFDQIWPNFTPPTAAPAPRANTTAYADGDVAIIGDYVVKYITAGTSGGSTPSLCNYFDACTDGTAQFALAYPTGYSLMQIDSGGGEVFVTGGTDFTGAADYGVSLTNTVGGGTPPYLVRFENVVVSTQMTHLMRLQYGNRVSVTGSHIGGCVDKAGGCAGISANFAWDYGLTVSDTRISDTQYCVRLQSATTSQTIITTPNWDDCLAGLYVDANVSDWTVSGGYIGSSVTTGFQIDAGTGNRYRIVGIINRAGTPINNGATGTDRSIWFGNAATSGGIPYYDANGVVQSSAALTANRLVLGGGAGTAPSVLGSLGTTTTVLHGNAAGAPTFGAVANADMATMADSTIKGVAVGAGTSTPTDLTATQVAAILSVPVAEVTVSMDFNSANTDFAITVPTRFTKYRVQICYINNTGTTASLTTARAGVFSSTGGGGVTLAADAALSAITTNANDTLANALQVVTNGTIVFTRTSTPTIYGRVSTPQGAAAGGTITCQFMGVQ